MNHYRLRLCAQEADSAPVHVVCGGNKMWGGGRRGVG